MRRVPCAANRRFEVLRFKFKFPRARTFELYRARFSAVAKPTFASQYSLKSSRRDLHYAPFCTVLESIFFVKNCKLYFQLNLRRSCASQLRAQREEVLGKRKFAPSENHGRKHNCLSLRASLHIPKGTSIITAKCIRSSSNLPYTGKCQA